MELRHLRYFVVVAEEENVTRAAERLHVSQPPLSRQIQDLEEELGVTLFTRTARTIRLTPAGRHFLEQARQILSQTEAAIKSVRAVSGGVQGELSLGFAPSLTVELLPDALRKFQADFPRVKVSLHDLSSEEMLAGLQSGKLDLVLMALPEGKRLNGFSHLRLRDYTLSVALPLHHRLASRKSVQLEELKEEVLLGYSRSGYPEYHEFLMQKLGCPKSRPGQTPIQEEHESVTSLMAAVESGRGVALVASCLGKLAGPRIKVRPILPSGMLVSLGVVWKGELVEGAASHFLEIIKAVS